MLASVYSYCVMVKSISSCCVRGRRVISNPVTYVLPLCDPNNGHFKYSYIHCTYMHTYESARK